MISRWLCDHRQEVWQTRTRRGALQTGYWCPDCRHYQQACYRLPFRRTVARRLHPAFVALLVVTIAVAWAWVLTLVPVAR